MAGLHSTKDCILGLFRRNRLPLVFCVSLPLISRRFFLLGVSALTLSACSSTGGTRRLADGQTVIQVDEPWATYYAAPANEPGEFGEQAPAKKRRRRRKPANRDGGAVSASPPSDTTGEH